MQQHNAIGVLNALSNPLEVLDRTKWCVVKLLHIVNVYTSSTRDRRKSEKRSDIRAYSQSSKLAILASDPVLCRSVSGLKEQTA